MKSRVELNSQSPCLSLSRAKVVGTLKHPEIYLHKLETQNCKKQLPQRRSTSVPALSNIVQGLVQSPAPRSKPTQHIPVSTSSSCLAEKVPAAFLSAHCLHKEETPEHMGGLELGAQQASTKQNISGLKCRCHQARALHLGMGGSRGVLYNTDILADYTFSDYESGTPHLLGNN